MFYSIIFARTLVTLSLVSYTLIALLKTLQQACIFIWLSLYLSPDCALLSLDQARFLSSHTTALNFILIFIIYIYNIVCLLYVTNSICTFSRASVDDMRAAAQQGGYGGNASTTAATTSDRAGIVKNAQPFSFTGAVGTDSNVWWWWWCNMDGLEWTAIDWGGVCGEKRRLKTQRNA